MYAVACRGFWHYPAWNAVVLSSALLALVLGTLVYALDRDWSSTYFLSSFAAWQPATLGIFGNAGLYLPSLFHAYAFSLLIVWAAGATRSARVTGTVGWFAAAACLEYLQAADMDPIYFERVARYAGSALSDGLRSYIENGRFDVGDILAAGLGCLVAYCATGILEKQR